MKQLGPLKFVEKYSLGTAEGQEELTVVFFHGYGADAFDLASLADSIATQKPTRFIFFQGFKEVPIGPGWTGRAWWDIDVARLQQAQLEGRELNLANSTYAGLPLAVEKASLALKALGQPLDKVVLGGFSQGAMLATHLCVTLTPSPRALVCLSGQLVHKEEWSAALQQPKTFKYFIGHGRQDPVLPYAGASRLESLFSRPGVQGEFYSFAGGHEIPLELLVRLSRFMESIY